jgi:hypothetical protein
MTRTSTGEIKDFLTPAKVAYFEEQLAGNAGTKHLSQADAFSFIQQWFYSKPMEHGTQVTYDKWTTKVSLPFGTECKRCAVVQLAEAVNHIAWAPLIPSAKYLTCAIVHNLKKSKLDLGEAEAARLVEPLDFDLNSLGALGYSHKGTQNIRLTRIGSYTTLVQYLATTWHLFVADVLFRLQEYHNEQGVLIVVVPVNGYTPSKVFTYRRLAKNKREFAFIDHSSGQVVINP